MTEFAERQRDADALWRQMRHEAEAVRCPECDAERGRTCVNVITAEPLAKQPAHGKRIALAGRAG